MESQALTKKRVLTSETTALHLAGFPQGPRELLAASLLSVSFSGKLDRDTVDGLGMNVRDVMWGLLPLAQLYALADFRVGAITQGASGSLYFGANLEIPRAPLDWTLHAEQSAVLGALVHGERSISRLTVTAAPCGLCRQFLNELGSASELEISLKGYGSFTVAQLLPHAFGPADLGMSGALLAKDDLRVQADPEESSAIRRAALDALRRSYAPYTRSPSAVALETEDGVVVGAPYVENAAYNPSVSPMLAALDRLRFHQATAAEIRQALLVEAKDSRIEQALETKEILKATGSEVELGVLKVRIY